MDFLEIAQANYTALAPAYEEMQQLYQRKLYHQLTDKIATFVSDPSNFIGRNMLELAEKFLSKFEVKVDQLRFAQIITKVATQLTPSSPPASGELEQAIEFIQKYLAKRGRIGDEGYVVLLMAVATYRLHQDRHDACKSLLEEAKTILDAHDGTEAVVLSTYYRARADFHNKCGPAADFYDNALLFLSYTSLDSLSTAEQLELAQDMALSALVGEGVYNFGEVVQHPILGALDGTPLAWLKELLTVFHHGNIDAFTTIVASNREAWDAQPALGMYEEQIKQKVALLCLMELASKRPATERTISFSDIASETQLPLDQVEWLLMRAMSLELIKGTIDEVDEVVEVTFIRPRVLDTEQVGVLKARFDTWNGRVDETLKLLERNTEELFA